MSAASKDTFFIGWASPPGPLRWFMMLVALVLIAIFAFSAYVIAATQDDPGGGSFGGRQDVIGILTAGPYPVVHVVESERYSQGHVLLLSGNGKRGVQDRAEPLDGQLVEISGQAINRGDIDMLQLRRGEDGMRAADGNPNDIPETEDLGRWRLAGEICDGKCYTGAMRPGQGLAHRACANFCFIGGVPPIFVTTVPVEGEEFLLIAGPDGDALPDNVMAHAGMLLELEGEVDRIGNLLVFRADPETLSVF
jgi:hypothetical protein